MEDNVIAEDGYEVPELSLGEAIEVTRALRERFGEQSFTEEQAGEAFGEARERLATGETRREP